LATLPTAAEPSGPDRLYSVEEAAARLGIGRTLAFGLCRDGRLRSLSIGRRRLVPSSALREYAESGERPVDGR
jgi:excisionase family DNA binding protein